MSLSVYELNGVGFLLEDDGLKIIEIMNDEEEVLYSFDENDVFGRQYHFNEDRTALSITSSVLKNYGVTVAVKEGLEKLIVAHTKEHELTYRHMLMSSSARYNADWTRLVCLISLDVPTAIPTDEVESALKMLRVLMSLGNVPACDVLCNLVQLCNDGADAAFIIDTLNDMSKKVEGINFRMELLESFVGPLNADNGDEAFVDMLLNMPFNVRWTELPFEVSKMLATHKLVKDKSWSGYIQHS